MSTKVIVTNRAALAAKYSPGGCATVQAAASRYRTHFNNAGDTVEIVYLDDAVQMGTLGAPPVTAANTPRENKASIDAVSMRLNADVITVLGAPDIVPHQILDNPAIDDDANVPSDLPYACSAPYSTTVYDFRAPSRIVGRMPDVTGQNDQGIYLAGLLDAAIASAPAAGGQYADYFAVSADVWSSSTTTSITSIFGNARNVSISPPNGPNWPNAQYAKLSHFANLHGASNTPQWFGQQGPNYPIAMDSANIPGKLQRGTVAAVEACYGAQLYDPALAGGSPALCNAYLSNGALGFFGSTTIAYGPAVGNGGADLLTQYFLANFLKGRSLGAAALAARQQFVSGNTPLTPSNLKTLAQFLLLGDPSISLVAPAQAHALTANLSFSGQVQAQILRAAGEELGQNVAYAVPTRVAVPDSVDVAMKAAVGNLGLIDQHFISYAFQSEGDILQIKAALPSVKLHVMYGKSAEHGKIRTDVIIEVLERQGQVLSVKTLYAR